MSILGDLGFNKEEQLIIATKSELVLNIQNLIYKRQLTQREAGAILGLSQPAISALLNSKLKLFSVEKLMVCLSRLGSVTHLSVKN